MRQDKKSSIEKILNCLIKTKINYCLGNESLDGISKGDLFRYGPEISLYVFDFSLIKKIKLRLFLFSKGLFINNIRGLCDRSSKTVLSTKPHKICIITIS